MLSFTASECGFLQDEQLSGLRTAARSTSLLVVLLVVPLVVTANRSCLGVRAKPTSSNVNVASDLL